MAPSEVEAGPGCAAARLAALALAICSRRAEDAFLYVWPGSGESEVIAVFADETDGLGACVPSPDVADDPREAVDSFLGASVAVFAGTCGFLNKPLIDGRFVGRGAANVLAPDLGTGTSGARFPGLGVLERGAEIALGGGIPCIEARTDLGVIFDGVWNDWILLLLRKGVPSMGESVLLYAPICDRKLETLSSKPELEPGLLPVLDCPLDPSDL